MSYRHAIYCAPSIESAFWRLGAKWLGRDAANGERIAQSRFEGILPVDFEAFTASPRRYGFHATLKGPMRLAKGMEPANLRDAVDAFASEQPPLEIGRMRVAELGRFVALVPEGEDLALNEFAGRCVSEFEAFRAPLTREERARRLASGLTPHQQEMLDAHGYPFVFAEFRLHFTLTDQLDDDMRARAKAAAEDWFAPVLCNDLRIDQLSIYGQDAPGLPCLRQTDHFLLGQTVGAGGTSVFGFVGIRLALLRHEIQERPNHYGWYGQTIQLALAAESGKRRDNPRGHQCRLVIPAPLRIPPILCHTPEMRDDHHHSGRRGEATGNN
jgi:putative phosphonate metabolism protein